MSLYGEKKKKTLKKYYLIVIESIMVNSFIDLHFSFLLIFSIIQIKTQKKYMKLFINDL
jgi:hypothetical protein